MSGQVSGLSGGTPSLYRGVRRPQVSAGKSEEQSAREGEASTGSREKCVRPGHFSHSQRIKYRAHTISGSASREGCRMSKGSMLKLFELNGRGQSITAVALPGQPHSQSGCLLLWTIQQPPCTGTQARGAGETDWWTPTRSVRPSSRAFGARRSTGHPWLLVNKRVHRHAGAWAPKSCGQP